MDYRLLGRTGVMVTPLCLGTMNFGHRVSEGDAIEIIQRAMDAGINFIDTANFYGQGANEGRGQGLTEHTVGKALKQSGKRDRIVLATKFTNPMDWDDPNARGGSRRHLVQQCEASLKRLDVDHIDLYQIHAPDRRVPFDETLRALDDLIRSGKVRYIGTSSFAAWQLVETLWVSKEYGLNRIVSEQPRYNILARNIERDVVAVAQRHNIALLPYAPLQGGLLSGRYQRNEPYPEDSRMADATWAEWAGGFMHDGVYDVIAVLQEMAIQKGCTITQLAIAWVMHQPAVASVIIGPRTMQHFEDNLGALNVEITEEDNKRIDAIAPLRK